jgi:hypothetical protein
MTRIRESCVCTEDGFRRFEEDIVPAVEASVVRATEVP